MYTMSIDGRPLYDPRMDEYALERPTLNQRANRFAALTFSIYPNHAEYANVQNRKSVIAVKLDGTLFLKARPVKDKMNFKGGIEAQCEELAARLNDMICRPHYFYGTAAEYLAYLVSDFNARYRADIPATSYGRMTEHIVDHGHTYKSGDLSLGVGELQTNLIFMGYPLPKFGVDNAFGDETESAVKAFQRANGLTATGIFGRPEYDVMVIILTPEPTQEPDMTFAVGTVAGIDGGNREYINDEYINYYDLMMERLVDELGGYIVPRYTEDKIYLDYMDDAHLPLSTQRIAFGENLSDLFIETDTTDTFSVLIPLGADVRAEDIHEGQATKTPLTIADVNGGYDYLENESGLSLYGRREKVMRWDGIKDASELKAKGQEFLQSHAVRLKEGVTVKAIDLRDTGADIEALRWMTRVPTYSTVHGVGEDYTISQKTTPLGIPKDARCQLGGAQETLTDRIAGNAARAAKAYASLSGRVFDVENPEEEPEEEPET